MAELEMLPAWAGRVAEPVHPPQPPTPPRPYGSEITANGSDTTANGSDDLAGGNGHVHAVLAGQPPLPSGEHRLEPGPETGPELGDDGDDAAGDLRREASVTTSELPVVSIPFEDEAAPAPDPVDLEDDAYLVEAELVDDEVEPAAGYGEPPQGEGLLDDLDHAPPVGDYLEEIVYEPDEIELLEDTDPIGVSPVDKSPMVVPVAGPEVGRSQGREQEVERDRPVMRVLSLLALAFVVVAAGVAAGYLFVALTGG